MPTCLKFRQIPLQYGCPWPAHININKKDIRPDIWWAIKAYTSIEQMVMIQRPNSKSLSGG